MEFPLQNPKLLSLSDLQKRISTWHLKSNKIVFTNGCFDIIHPGHVQYLKDAKSLGHKLVVAVNTDNSVKRLGKGDGRPYNNELVRSFILAGLTSIDALILFDEDTPLETVKALLPDVLVKGGDYDANCTDESNPTYIVGAKEVLANGGEVKSISFVDGFSTTNLVNKIKQS